MKKLILLAVTISIASYSLIASAEKFQQGYSDYLESSLCIKSKIANGVDRSNIVVVGPTCYTK